MEIFPWRVVGKYQYGLAKKTIEVHYSDPRHWNNVGRMAGRSGNRKRMKRGGRARVNYH